MRRREMMYPLAGRHTVHHHIVQIKRTLVHGHKGNILTAVPSELHNITLPLISVEPDSVDRDKTVRIGMVGHHPHRQPLAAAIRQPAEQRHLQPPHRQLQRVDTRQHKTLVQVVPGHTPP